jgi:TusA-related sulfurtransferase
MVELDACGLQCPGPIMQVYRQMQALQPGQVLRVLATDPGFAREHRSLLPEHGQPLARGQAGGRADRGHVAQAGQDSAYG